MTKTDALVVGAGPIGLTASILLKQQGVAALVIDKKQAFDNHPRARFMDSCTLELFRQMGVADAIEATGIGRIWTKTVNCFTRLGDEPIAKSPSPEFHSVARAITPQVPVMTCQDLIEPILYERAKSLGVEVMLGQSFVALSQQDDGCKVEIEDASTGERKTVDAGYVIGCDGVHSPVRKAIGGHLEGEVRDTFYRDVLFHADLSPWLDARDNQGALLWVAHANGTGMYQPLDGKQRFRAQIAGLDPETEYDDDYFKDWIKASVGADADFPIDIFSKLIWRVSARTADQFQKGRVLLAGDAAHLFTPTGGMGMNTAFAGVRNLAWKLAFVIKGLAPESILETYEAEWKPQAIWRSAVALENHDFIVGVYRAYFAGEGLDEALAAFEQYTDYPGVIFGYRVDSPLVKKDTGPQSRGSVREYFPAIKSGARLPHIWLDKAKKVSILDHCGSDYLLVLAPDADARWDIAVEKIRAKSFPMRAPIHVPIHAIRLTREQAESTVYAEKAAVLVRPDIIVATHISKGEAVDPMMVLSDLVPSGESKWQ
ncbi:MAG: FAD-dependent monooxygenase [Pseudomonadales bacterium]